MGEKSGSMTNMIIVLVGLVIIVGFVNIMFPQLTTDIGAGMTNVVNDALSNATNIGGN
ncbi:hypothetical protein [Cytobacillus horneckiae]|uniref:hypothetical protein n=1 Tax=Cytobacillus horneckiae TaxID=549687 RepID=UPI000A728E20|nr:hypothetical protein [Cytobacillus horneckiae]MEC1158685.1 hypothetical protein [Cytobacillus horneckiae]NRG44029.1 hypothetical protein [Bacillus sp. CRN 9]